MSCSNSVFGPNQQYIKVTGNEFIAIDGSNIFEKLNLANLRLPYKQLLKSRVILKAGQVNYLLNHLGLGDNATFVLIKATFDAKSTIEVDNYLTWSYYDDMGRVNSMSQLMLLTGNSTNRIPQIYISNPNLKYNVTLELMVAIVDDNYSFFSDTINQSGRSFINIHLTDIKTHILGESILIYDNGVPQRPLLYIVLNNIQSIERTYDILTIQDSSVGPIFLKFIDEYNAIQSQSLISYILENPSVDIDNINPIEDIQPPIIYFNSKFGTNGDYIGLNGVTMSVPYNTLSGNIFTTTALLADYSGLLSKNTIISEMIDIISDNRDGVISMTGSQVTILDNLNISHNSITATGSYTLKVDVQDIALNNLDDISININIL